MLQELPGLPDRARQWAAAPEQPCEERAAGAFAAQVQAQIAAAASLCVLQGMWVRLLVQVMPAEQLRVCRQLPLPLWPLLAAADRLGVQQ